MAHHWSLTVLIGLALLFALSASLTWKSDVPLTISGQADNEAHVDGVTFPRTLVDSFGYRFTLKQPPQRIVSAMLASDEILLDLVPRERILAVTSYATNPAYSNCVEQARGIQTISGLGVENLLALEPDLVLAARFANVNVVTQLRQCGSPLFCFGQFETLQDIRRNVQLLGAAVGEEQQAGKIVAWMDRALQEVSKRTAGASHRPRVLYYYLRFTFGKGTIFDELVQAGGGINVAAEANIIGPKDISPELIPSLNPDIVIVPRQLSSSSKVADPKESLLGDPVWQSILSDGRVKVIDLPQAQLTAISHHVVKAAVGLGHALHPARVPSSLPVVEQAPSVARP